MDVHQCATFGVRVDLPYLSLDLLGRTLLEESHVMPLFFRSDVDHILRAAHIAEERLQLGCCLDLLLLANHSETSGCEELIIEFPGEETQEELVLEDLGRPRQGWQVTSESFSGV